MASVPIKLFLSLSKFINLHHPLLLMTQEEQIPLCFCTGKSLPIICSQYPTSDSNNVANLLQSSSVEYNPIFISDGKHNDLIMKLRKSPLLFSWTRLWVMPLEYKSMVPRRLDNNILFYEKNASSGYTVYESYTVKNDEQAAMTNMLFDLNEDEGNKAGLNHHVNTIERRLNMNGAILKNFRKPYGKRIIFTRDEDGTIVKTEGMYKDIVDDIQDMMNCVILSVEQKGFFKMGQKLCNGTWTGPMGKLKEGDFDLKEGLMTSEFRRKHLDFTWKFDEVRISLQCSSPTVPKLDIWAYLMIFPMTAWVIGFALMVVATLWFSLSANEPITKSFTLIGRLFLQMGYDVQAKGVASKSFFLVAAMCLNLIFIYFCSDLTGKMTSDPKTLNIRSFKDVESQGYELLIQKGDGSSATRLLRTAPEGKAMRRMFDNGNFLALDKEEIMSIDLSKNPKTLLWAFEGRHGKLGLSVIDITENAAIDKSFAMKKGSELTKIFNNNILKMQERGLINRSEKKWYGDRAQIFEMTEPIVLAFDNLIFPFGCLAVGILIAIPITVAEVISTFGGRYRASKRWAIEAKMATNK